MVPILGLFDLLRLRIVLMVFFCRLRVLRPELSILQKFSFRVTNLFIFGSFPNPQFFSTATKTFSMIGLGFLSLHLVRLSL